MIIITIIGERIRGIVPIGAIITIITPITIRAITTICEAITIATTTMATTETTTIMPATSRRTTTIATTTTLPIMVKTRIIEPTIAIATLPIPPTVTTIILMELMVVQGMYVMIQVNIAVLVERGTTIVKIVFVKVRTITTMQHLKTKWVDLRIIVNRRRNDRDIQGMK